MQIVSTYKASIETTPDLIEPGRTLGGFRRPPPLATDQITDFAIPTQHKMCNHYGIFAAPRHPTRELRNSYFYRCCTLSAPAPSPHPTLATGEAVPHLHPHPQPHLHSIHVTRPHATVFTVHVASFPHAGKRVVLWSSRDQH